MSESENVEISRRLAVCQWSLKAETPADLVSLLKQVEIDRIQLGLDWFHLHPPWVEADRVLAEAGIEIASGMFMAVGEDYSTLESIRRTGGIVPDETWPKTWENFQKIVPIAHRLQLGLVTFHAGFLPEDETDPAYDRLLDRLRHMAELSRSAGLALGFETGQEDAATLCRFLERLDQPNVGVNFDPANMILYDKGDPIESLRRLGPFLRQVHIKDARRTQVPGEWGEEVAVGAGEVDWPAFFVAMRELGYAGDLVVEREAGEARVADIIAARQRIEELAVG